MRRQEQGREGWRRGGQQAQGERWFPRDEDYGRRYRSQGYREEFGDFGNADAMEGPGRQGRDWQADQDRDFRMDRSRRSLDREGGMEYGRGQGYGQGYGQNFNQNRGQDFGQSFGQNFGQEGGQAYSPFMGSQGNPGNSAGFEGGSYWRPEPGIERQSFRGRGPKGYARSDERLKEMICERLTEDGQIDASDISVEVSNCEVTLSGSVPDRQTKFRAEELVERCGAVKDIRNELRVERLAGAQQGSQDSASSRKGSRNQGGNGCISLA